MKKALVFEGFQFWGTYTATYAEDITLLFYLLSWRQVGVYNKG